MFKFYRKSAVYDAAFDFSVHVVAPDSRDQYTTIRNDAVMNMLDEAGFRHRHLLAGAYLPRDPVKGCSLSHAMVIQQAAKQQRPILLLENDAMLSKEAPADLRIEVPQDADAVYLGISTGGLVLNASERTYQWLGNYYSKTPVNNILKIYNMLSTHAVLILTDRMARNWQVCAMEAALRNVPVDTVIARTHRHFNVYAQENPWFYQAEHLGGQEKYTKIQFDGTEISSVADLPLQLSSFTPPCIAADLAALA